MIDNFDLIEGLISKIFDKNTPIYDSSIDMQDVYYHLQIIKRSKDTGEGASSVCLKAYQIDLHHPISKYKDDIINLCERFKARAYINVSPKSKKATAIQMLNNLANCFRQNDYQYLNRIWNSAAGQVGALVRYWVVDCDFSTDFTTEDVAEVAKFIDTQCQPLDREKCVTAIPTRNGIHLITTPFDLRAFRESYPDIDVHKNNPTVLYIPKSIEEHG